MKCMKKIVLSILLIYAVLFYSCDHPVINDASIKAIDPASTARYADSMVKIINPRVPAGFTTTLWGIDSLVISPIAIDIDDMGRLYYTTTDRQKNSEFDIRGYRN